VMPFRDRERNAIFRRVSRLAGLNGRAGGITSTGETVVVESRTWVYPPGDNRAMPTIDLYPNRLRGMNSEIDRRAFWHDQSLADALAALEQMTPAEARAILLGGDSA
jgi:hypothetical protein